MGALVLFWTMLLLVASGECQDDGLSVDFSIQSPDNSSRPVSEVQINTTSRNRFNVICFVSDKLNVIEFRLISILRNRATGGFQQLAFMPHISSKPEVNKPTLDPEFNITDVVVIGTFNVTNPSLGISIPVSNMSCEDAATYNCSLIYISTASYQPMDISTLRSLTVSAPPSTLQMDAINVSSGLPITDMGVSASNLATFMIGQAVNLTCNASLGTHKDAIIIWKKNNKVMGNETDYSESNAQLVSKCDYEKTGSLVYNITEEDVEYTFHNPLVLQCLVSVADTSFETPEYERRSFYIQVYNPNEPSKTTATTVHFSPSPTATDVSNGQNTSPHSTPTATDVSNGQNTSPPSGGSCIKLDPPLTASFWLMFILELKLY